MKLFCWIGWHTWFDEYGQQKSYHLRNYPAAIIRCQHCTAIRLAKV